MSTLDAALGPPTGVVLASSAGAALGLSGGATIGPSAGADGSLPTLSFLSQYRAPNGDFAVFLPKIEVFSPENSRIKRGAGLSVAGKSVFNL